MSALLSYANKENLEMKIVGENATKSVGELMTEEEKVQHNPAPRKQTARGSYVERKPHTKKSDKAADDIGDDSDSMPMSECNISSREETEILINEKGEIIGERLRTDLPR